MTAITANRRRTLHFGTALATCFACMGFASGASGQTLPDVNNPGGATLSSPDASTLNVNLNNANRIITWKSFSIGGSQNETVNFVSTNGGGTANTTTPFAVLNRVTGSTPSNIDGALTSQKNIQVWLANSNGIVFGNKGSFSGGSLVLTTLTNNITTAFNRANAHLPAELSGNSKKSVTLKDGSSLGTTAAPLAGSVLAVAQVVSAGGRINAAGNVDLVAARDVQFSSTLGSPLSFTITSGSTLSGVHVLGTGNIDGANVQVVAGTVNNMVSNLLQVDPNAQLTATDADGGVILRAVTTGGATQSLTDPQISSQGQITAGDGTGAVRITGTGPVAVGGTIDAGGDVVLTAASKLTASGQVTAGGQYGAFGKDIVLGNGAAAVAQVGGNGVVVQSTAANGSIVGAAGLTLRLDTGVNAGLDRVVIDAGSSGTITFAAGSKIIARGTAGNSDTAEVGLRFDASKALKLGDVTASTLADFNGLAIGSQLTGDGDFTAGTILTENTFSAKFGGSIALVGATASNNLANVVLNAGGDLSTTGALKAKRDVTLTAVGSAKIGGAVSAGADFAVKGADVALGNGSNDVLQTAARTVTVTTTGGDITGAAGLTLRSNSDANGAANTLVLDATNTGAIDFELGSTLAAGSGTGNGAGNAAIGLRFDRTAPGAALVLGNVVAARIGDYTGTVGGQLTGVGDFTAGTVTSNQAFDADFGGAIRIASIKTTGATADVTLRAGGLIGGSQGGTAATSITSSRDIALTAGTNIALGVIRGDDVSASAGADFAPVARQNGSITLADADVTGDLKLLAWGTGAGGAIRVGTGLADGTLTLDNTQDGGTAGSIKVADHLQSNGLLTLHSAGDILVASYAGTGTAGTVTSSNAAIDAAAVGSVLGYDADGDKALDAFAITQPGIAGLSATGNLTVNTAGASDVSIASLEAGGDLTLNVDGNLYGRSQSTTQVPGGAFKGQTGVTVSAGAASGVINLARVESKGPVSLTAGEIAVGILASGGAASLTAPAAHTYVGLQRITGDATVTLGSAFVDVGTVTPGNFYAAATDLTAGGIIDATVTGAAELGYVLGTGNVTLRTGGIVANYVTSAEGALSVRASSGTLALGVGAAALDLTLDKRGGNLLSVGDDLRFTALTSGLAGVDGQRGDTVLTSQTHVRGKEIEARGGDVSISAGYDAGTDAVDRAGEITGLSGGAMAITATALSDVPSDGRIFAQSGALQNYARLKAGADISIVAGGAAAPLNGAIRLDSAQAGGGIYLTNKNAAAGSPTGIQFQELHAASDITLITSIGNGGDVVGSLIDARAGTVGSVHVSARNIQVNSIQGDGDVALAATGGITNIDDSDGILIGAGHSIAADAGLTMRVATAQGTTGDVALRATGAVIAKTLTAADDVTVSGSSVRLGSATSTGTGDDATDVSFAPTTPISDPFRPGYSAQVPSVDGAQLAANTGGNVFVTATTGDVTGFSPIASPALALVTTGSTLSGSLGSADLTARGRSGSIAVSAVNGAAQLGTLQQGVAATGTGHGNVTVSAKAISAGSVTAQTGNASLTASEGTLVVGAVSALDTVSLTKRLVDPAAATLAGNEIRFTSVRGGQGETDVTRLALLGTERLGIDIESATGVRGETAATPLGGVRVIAGLGSITGLSIDASGSTLEQNVTLRSATAMNLGTVVARDRVSAFAGASGSRAGSISVDDVSSLEGSVYLTAVNTLAGSASDITYDTLAAGGEIVAITSGSNRGDVRRLANSTVPFAIDAGTRVSIDARSLDLGTVRAKAGSIALRATDFIAANTLDAGTSVAGLAGGAISVGSADAAAGDVAFRAGGVLRFGSATATDDILLTGSTVRFGSATTSGGAESADADFASLTSIGDPTIAVAGSVPRLSGGMETPRSSIVVLATSGDVTGLPADPLVTPALALVTTQAQLSSAYGKANLNSAGGRVTVTAASGAAQLGTVLQGTAPGTFANNDITITARAISADTVTARNGSFALTATTGTLVLGSGSAAGSAGLFKQGGSAAVDGDELRVIGADGVDGTLGVAAISDTHVRGTVLASSGTGSLVVDAKGDVSGLKASSAALLPLPLLTAGSQLTSAYGTLDLTTSAEASSITVAAQGAAQLGDVTQYANAAQAFAPTAGLVQVSAEAISAGTIRAYAGGIDLSARTGTLVLDSASASAQLRLNKTGGTVGTPGDEIRFTTLAAGQGGAAAPLGEVSITSQTHIRGNAVTAQNGSVTLRAGYDGAATTQAGEITGLAFAPSDPKAMVVTATASSNASGAILASSGGRVQFGALSAAGDLSIVSGGIDPGLNGAIRLTKAASGGSIYLTNKNTAAGSPTDITFDTLVAAGDAVLVTSAGNGGDVTGSLIDAGGHARVAANDIGVGTIQAKGDIALNASGGLIVDKLAAGGGIGADAGLTIALGSAKAGSTDVALRAGGTIEANSIEAADDVTLSGTALTVRTVTALGTGNDASDVNFAGPDTATNPYDPDFSAPIPTVNAGTLVADSGGNIFATATAGDITVSELAMAQGSVLLGATGKVTVATGTATSGTVGILAGGDVTSSLSLTAGEDLAIRSGGTVRLAAATAGDDLTVSAPGKITIDTVVITGQGNGGSDVVFDAVPALRLDPASLAANNLALGSSAGDVVLGAVTVDAGAADASANITAAGSVSIARDVAVRGGLTILAAGDVTLGDDADRSQAATGLVSVASTGGAILQGTGRLALGANSDGSGSEALTLGAQSDVALGNADLTGGTARQSAVTVTANTGAVTIGSASGATFASTAGTGFTARGAIATGGAALGADTGAPTVSIVAKNGSLVATTIDAAEAGHDVLLRASQAITLDRVGAGRSIDAAGGTGVTGNTLVAASGDLTVASGGAIAVGSSTSGGASSYASGANTTLDTLDAGGTTTIRAGGDAKLGTLVSTGDTAITAGGAIVQLISLDTQGTVAVTAGSTAMLGALKAAGAAQIAAKSGALSVGDLTSGGAATLSAADSVTFGTVSANGAGTVTAGTGVSGTALASTGAANVTAGNAVALGRVNSGGAASVTAGTTAKVDQLGSGGLTSIKAGTDATLGSVTSAGDATVTAKGTVALTGAFTAAAHRVTLSAKDAAIGADVTAATITVVNDGAAGNKLVLGDNASGTGFTLSAAEVGRLKASDTLTLDAASAGTKQDVSIGALSLTTPAKVLILADGTRIDVTGKIDVSGATTSLQIGGSGPQAGLASVLRVAAKADGTGGSIAAPTADVSLRAGDIGFGQDAGFLSALALTDGGTGDATVALGYNDKASSTLYFAATNGGSLYTPSLAGVKLLTANNLSLTYTNFALFQNTGVQRQTSGVDIGTFLTVNADGARPVLGLFGTVAGRQGTAAALLGDLAFQINLNDVRSSRINGCVVGEGAGCISTVVFSPTLTAIDAVRPSLFTVASDYEVPFNPLIGTNNDALFGDVGTFGLEDMPLAPIECSDPNNSQCPAPGKDGK